MNEFNFDGQLLTKEDVKKMFEIDGVETKMIFSDEPPSDNELWGQPLELPNWIVYPCTKNAKENIIDEDVEYWFVAVENKNPTAEYSIELNIDELNEEDEIVN